MRKLFFNIVIVLCISIVSLAAVKFLLSQHDRAQAAGAAQLLLAASATTVSPNQNFTVAIGVDTQNQPVYGIDAQFNFNSTLLDVISVTLGNSNFKTLAPGTNNVIDLTKAVTINAQNPAQSKLEFGIITFDQNTQQLTGSVSGLINPTPNPLATITFKAKAAGSAGIGINFTGSGQTTDANIVTTENGQPVDLLAAPIPSLTIAIVAPSPTPAASVSPSPSISPSPTLIPTPTPTPTPTPSPTPTPTPTPNPTPTPTPTPTPVPTPSPSVTPSPTPVPSASPTPTPLPSPTVTIISPADQSTVNPDISLTFNVTNWVIAQGGNHLHLFIDDIDQGPTYTSDPIGIFGLSIGGHTLSLKLANPDHTFTGVEDSVTITVEAVCTLAYDFNNDNKTDIVDVMQVANRWNSEAGQNNYDARFDLDNDGDIDIIDVARVASTWGSSCP